MSEAATWRSSRKDYTELLHAVKISLVFLWMEMVLESLYVCGDKKLNDLCEGENDSPPQVLCLWHFL